MRPGYPSALYDRIIDCGDLTASADALEVGVGTGKATLPLAERGFRICGLEPGASLAAIARANLGHFPLVSIHTTSFEDWTVARGAFGLAFIAQAFHWLDPVRRLPKLAGALRAGGVLAIFGNVPNVPDGPLRRDLDAFYANRAPTLSARRDAANWYASAESPVMLELRASQAFCDTLFEVFDWRCSLTAASYCALLATYSDHSTLPATELTALLASVAEVIDSHGGAVPLCYKTGLFLARAV